MRLCLEVRQHEELTTGVIRRSRPTTQETTGSEQIERALCMCVCRCAGGSGKSEGLGPAMGWSVSKLGLRKVPHSVWGWGGGRLYQQPQGSVSPGASNCGDPAAATGRAECPSPAAGGIHMLHIYTFFLLPDLHPGQPERGTAEGYRCRACRCCPVWLVMYMYICVLYVCVCLWEYRISPATGWTRGPGAAAASPPSSC